MDPVDPGASVDWRPKRRSAQGEPSNARLAAHLAHAEPKESLDETTAARPGQGPLSALEIDNPHPAAPAPDATGAEPLKPAQVSAKTARLMGPPPSNLRRALAEAFDAFNARASDEPKLTVANAAQLDQVALGLYRAGYDDGALAQVAAALNDDAEKLDTWIAQSDQGAGRRRPGAQDRAAREAARSLVELLRHVLANPQSLLPAAPLYDIDPRERVDVQWSSAAQSSGRLVVAGGALKGKTVDVARTREGVLLAGLREGETFIAFDQRGAPAGRFLVADTGLWEAQAPGGKPRSPGELEADAARHRAREAVARGALTLALRHFDQALAGCPGDARMLAERAETLLALSRAKDAGRDIDQAIASGGPNPQRLYLKGRVQQAQGDVDGAGASFDAALAAIAPRLSGALYGNEIFWAREDVMLAAAAHLAAGRPAAAAANFEHVLKDAPRDNAARAGLARALFEMDERKAARAQVLAVLEAAPRDIEAWALRAKIEDASGDQESAARCYTEAADLCFDQADFGRALVLYAEVLRRSPEDAHALTSSGFALDLTGDPRTASARFVEAGEVCLRAGRLHDAGRNFDYACSRAKNSVPAEMGRARTLLALGDAQAAQKLFERVLSIDPNHLDALVGKGEASMKTWDYATASRCFDEVLERAPTHVGALVAAGELCLRDRAYSMAEYNFDLALGFDPDHLRARLGKAACERVAGRPAVALEHYDFILAREPGNGAAISARLEALRQIEPDPAMAETFIAAAHSLLAESRAAEALLFLEQIAPFAADSAPFWQARGQALLVLSRFDDALGALVRAQQLRPDDVSLLQSVARASLGAEDFESALEYFERADARLPDTANRLGRAEAMIGMGRFEEALQAFDAVLQADEQNIAAHIGKGRAQIGLDEFDAAYRSFGYALGIEPGNADALAGRDQTLAALAAQRAR